MLKKILHTNPSKSVILIRLMIGSVFLSEGIQKFLYPESRGAGRFAKIGLPAPELLGDVVGTLEILCGLLILIGLFTRLSSIPLIAIMLGAFVITKSEIFLHKGFWEFLHESRTDLAMLLGSTFLLITGGGQLSIDYLLYKKSELT